MNDFGLRKEVLDFIVDAARSNGLDQVILFGSRATGEYSEKSDIDLAVSGPNLYGFEESLEEHCPTLLAFDFVDLSRQISDALRNRIATEGVCLYG